MKRLLMIIGIVFLISACSGSKENPPAGHGSIDDGETVNGYGSIDHGIDDKKVGFGLVGESVEEAQGVPSAVKEQILQAFEIYIDAFNDKDIANYINVLSKHTESFDLEEEREYMTDVFNEFDLERKASDITIVKYSDTEAQVFSKLQTLLKQLSSGLETKQNGRQVTVFTKDNGDWKVASVHYIGDN